MFHWVCRALLALGRGDAMSAMGRAVRPKKLFEPKSKCHPHSHQPPKDRVKWCLYPQRFHAPRQGIQPTVPLSSIPCFSLLGPHSPALPQSPLQFHLLQVQTPDTVTSNQGCLLYVFHHPLSHPTAKTTEPQSLDKRKHMLWCVPVKQIKRHMYQDIFLSAALVAILLL